MVDAPVSGGSEGARNATLTIFVGGEAAEGMEPWVTDGSVAGTMMVADLVPGPAPSNVGNFTPAGSLAVFTATDATNTTDVWGSDGTGSGTLRLTAHAPIGASSTPSTFEPLPGGGVFFSASSPATGFEPWTSDGTAAGTSLVAIVRPGAGTFAMSNLPPQMQHPYPGQGPGGGDGRQSTTAADHHRADRRRGR